MNSKKNKNLNNENNINYIDPSYLTQKTTLNNRSEILEKEISNYKNIIFLRNLLRLLYEILCKFWDQQFIL